VVGREVGGFLADSIRYSNRCSAARTGAFRRTGRQLCPADNEPIGNDYLLAGQPAGEEMVAAQIQSPIQ
jgi:hypothetical protein